MFEYGILVWWRRPTFWRSILLEIVHVTWSPLFYVLLTLSTCYHESCSFPLDLSHSWQQRGHATKVVTYEYLNPQMMNGCHVGWDILRFMPLNPKWKGDTQTYPKRTDLKLITRSNPNKECVRWELKTLDLRNNPRFKECFSGVGYRCLKCCWS